MPELPEVEVVRAGLEPAVTGALVTAVTVLDERSLRRHPGPWEGFAEQLLGRRLALPERRGKFLWMRLGGAPRALVVHLGMSGQLLLHRPDHPVHPHSRVLLGLSNPVHGDLRVDFVDQRIFGSLALNELVRAPDAAGQSIPARVGHIARDPLDPLFDDSGFLAALARRRTGIKRALLDQTLISGIGNIYADEALWAARIHYEHPADALPGRRALALLAELRAVLRRALAEGGTSFDRQYLNVNGQAGYFTRSLNAYGRTGQPCPRCGAPIVRVPFMNRSSHICARCQRLR